MSEKRFILDDESRIWDNGDVMTALDIVFMLNEQQVTINELKEEMVRLHKMSIELMDRVIPNLRRENEQLKKELKWKREEIKALIEESERDE